MDQQDIVKSAIERNVKVITARPAVGRGQAVTRVTLKPGLACEVQEGAWTLQVGMTDKYGGTNSGPNPGVFGRGALGSCIAIGYAMWAARLDVPITALSVEVQADYDVSGELGVSEDVRPGHSKIHYIVSVESDAPEERIREWIDLAERKSSWLDNIRNPVPVTSELRLTRPGGA